MSPSPAPAASPFIAFAFNEFDGGARGGTGAALGAALGAAAVDAGRDCVFVRGVVLRPPPSHLIVCPCRELAHALNHSNIKLGYYSFYTEIENDRNHSRRM